MYLEKQQGGGLMGSKGLEQLLKQEKGVNLTGIL